MGSSTEEVDMPTEYLEMEVSTSAMKWTDAQWLSKRDEKLEEEGHFKVEEIEHRAKNMRTSITSEKKDLEQEKELDHLISLIDSASMPRNTSSRGLTHYFLRGRTSASPLKTRGPSQQQEVIKDGKIFFRL